MIEHLYQRERKQQEHLGKLQDALSMAELSAAGSALAGPILHMRERGHAARRGSNALLAALIVTVAFGLAYYLLLPFVKQFVDGRGATLEQSVAATERALDALAADRDRIRTDLVAALRQVAERLPPLPGSESVAFLGALATGPDSALVFGTGGTIVEVSDRFTEQTALALMPSAPDDPAEGRVDPLVGFITGLPPDARERPAVIKLRAEAEGFVARETVLRDLLATDKDRIAGLERFPYSYFLRDRQREDFAAFMATCRGATDWQAPPEPKGVGTPDPDGITMACLSGWKDQVTQDSPTWWQTLAAQIPPGILLLFLLSTLAGLYRYNLRLSGFHHARADALELFAMGKTKDEIGMLSGIADVLAADKVVFGHDDAATRQAVSILQAIKPGS